MVDPDNENPVLQENVTTSPVDPVVDETTPLAGAIWLGEQGLALHT